MVPQKMKMHKNHTGRFMTNNKHISINTKFTRSFCSSKAKITFTNLTSSFISKMSSKNYTHN